MPQQLCCYLQVLMVRCDAITHFSPVYGLHGYVMGLMIVEITVMKQTVEVSTCTSYCILWDQFSVCTKQLD